MDSKVIKIDSSELKRYEKKLNDLHRSAFPNAIRSTLNDAAFEMKKNNLHTSAAKNFKHTRSKSFFKKFSGVKKAKGWDINKMYSEIGMLDMGNKSARKAVENMKLHEIGGVIDDGSQYLKGSRVSESYSKLVRKVNYYDKNRVVSGRSSLRNGKGTRKSKFVARAYRSLKEGKPIFMNSMKGNILVQVHNIQHRNKKKVRIKSTLLMKERDSVKITPNKFITKAAGVTQKDIPLNFQKNAEYQIKKRMK